MIHARRRAPALLVLASLASVLVALWIALRRDWIEPVPGVSLEPVLPQLSDRDFGKESGYRLLLAACERLKASGWKAPGQEIPQEALELARRAAAAPGGRVPSVTRVGSPLRYLIGAQELTRLLGASAARRAGSGDSRGALGDLDAAMRIGNLVARGGGLSNHWAGISCQIPALKGIRLCALRCPLSAEALKGAGAALSALEGDLPDLSESLRQEARSEIACIPTFYANPHGLRIPSPLRGALGSSPDATARNLGSVYTHLLDMACRPYDPKAQDAFVSATFGRTGWGTLLLKDPVGYDLSRASLPPAGFRTPDLRRLADLRATRSVLAILAFRAETGRLPERLGDLCPRFLDAVPLDPFDGKPLRYSRGGDAGWTVSLPDPALSFPGNEPEAPD